MVQSTISAEIRRELLKKWVLEENKVPTIKEIMERFEISQTTAVEDKKAVREELSQGNWDEIREGLIEIILERLPEMSDKELIRLLSFFKPRMTESKIDAEIKDVRVGWKTIRAPPPSYEGKVKRWTKIAGEWVYTGPDKEDTILVPEGN